MHLAWRVTEDAIDNAASSPSASTPGRRSSVGSSGNGAGHEQYRARGPGAHGRQGRHVGCALICGAQKPFAEALEAIRVYVTGKKPGQWIVGSPWHPPSQLAEKRYLTRQEIDAVAPDHPVFLPTVGHFVMSNSRALAAAGITKATPNPAGGIIERDAGGESWSRSAIAAAGGSGSMSSGTRRSTLPWMRSRPWTRFGRSGASASPLHHGWRALHLRGTGEGIDRGRQARRSRCPLGRSPDGGRGRPQGHPSSHDHRSRQSRLRTAGVALEHDDFRCSCLTGEAGSLAGCTAGCTALGPGFRWAGALRP